jgi:hypothetical protein
VRELRVKLRFKCDKCDYTAKRERDLKRHAKIQNKADNRVKTELGEMDNKGRDLRNPQEFIGLVNLSRKLMVAGEKEKSSDDFFAIEPPQKFGLIKQADAPETSKTKSK